MASVMGTGSEVFGSSVGEIDVLVEIENRDIWLCCGCKYLRIIFGGESALRMAVEVGDGARYWRALWVLWA